MASQSENTADNQSTVFLPSKKTKTLVESIKKRLGKWATKNNNLKLEDTRYIREEISNCVADLFSEYVIDFYAKPEDLRKQIMKFCENNTTNEQVTEKIVSSLVDDNGRNGRDPEYIFQGPADVEKKLSVGQETRNRARNQATVKQETCNQETWNQTTGNTETWIQHTGNQEAENQTNRNQATGNEQKWKQGAGNPETGNQATGNQETGNQAAGNQAIGNQATGNQESGSQAAGNQETGNQATGNQETGNQAARKQETGNKAAGNQETGNPETRNQLTGNQATGNQETGNQAIWKQETGYQETGNQATVNQDTWNQTTSNLETGNQATGNQEIKNQTTGNQETWNHETGNQTTGNQETGNQETGNRETWNQDTGNQEAGNQTTLNQATGNKQTGKQGTGNQETGNQPTGNQETGNKATGNKETGNQSTGNQETGNDVSTKQETGNQAARKQETGNKAAGNQETGNPETRNQLTWNQATGNQETGNQAIWKQETGYQETGNQATVNQDTWNQTTSNLETGNQATGNQEIENQTTGNQETWNHETGNQTTGNQETGNQETGNQTTGNRETWNQDTGNQESGNQTTLNQATGNKQTGKQGTGNQETGNQPTGNQETGNKATGNKETGNQSTGNQETGNDVSTKQETGNEATKYNESENKEIEQFCRAISDVTHKINWNKDFCNVINSSGDDYNTRRKQIADNLKHFFVTNNQDLSVVEPCIKEKKELILYLLPPISILMEPETGEKCKLRRYKYKDETKYWYQRLYAENLTCPCGEDYSFLTDMYRFAHRSGAMDTKFNFDLDKENIIYLLEIRFQVDECKRADRTHSLYYVGKASGGVLDRWCVKDTSHMNEVWKVWAEMHISPIPSELSGQLVHHALAYAHVMGYQTQLFIVDRVPDDAEERINVRIKKTKDIITESKTSDNSLEQVWERKKPEFTRGEGRETRSRTDAEKEFPPFSFVQWYQDRPTKPRLQNPLDVFEWWWHDRMESTADKNGFTSLKRPKYLTREVTSQLYTLVKWSASQDTS